MPIPNNNHINGVSFDSRREMQQNRIENQPARRRQTARTSTASLEEMLNNMACIAIINIINILLNSNGN